MSNDDVFQMMANNCDSVADELVLAAKHMVTMAEHFRNREVPRAGAHYMATQGHIEKAKALLSEISISHAEKAQPNNL